MDIDGERDPIEQPDDDIARAIDAEPDADLHLDPDMALDPPPFLATEAPRNWRAARCITKLREQVNAAFPNRNKKSDGIVGDPSHESRASDHNPWIVDGGLGVVVELVDRSGGSIEFWASN